MKNELQNEKEINIIYMDIKELVINSRKRVYNVVNTEMLSLYWHIGKRIISIQDGKNRAKYGENVLEKLSERLTAEFDKGFSLRNIRTMRKKRKTSN